MPDAFNLVTKPIGEILEEAGLINDGQLQVVLMEQSTYCDLKLGEILALHGWLKQETADFFAERMRQIIKENNYRLKIGKFFNQASLLTERDIDTILNEQKKTGVKFGAIAVMKGLLKEQTLDFFLKYFALEINRNTDFQYKDEQTLVRKRITLQTKTKANKRETITNTLSNYFEQAMVHFARINSARTRSERIEHLQGFMHCYQNIEEIQMKSDPSLGQLPYHRQEQLDKVHLWVLSEIQRTSSAAELA